MGGNGRVGVHGDQHDLEPRPFLQRHGIAATLLPRVFVFDLHQQGREVKGQQRRIEWARGDRMWALR